MLANALGIEPWELIRPMDGKQREVYEKIEAAYRALQKNDPALAAQASEAQASSKTSAAKPSPSKKPKQHA